MRHEIDTETGDSGRRLARVILLSALATLAAPASRAEKPAPRWVPAAPPVEQPASPRAASGSPCTIGEAGPPVFSVNYIVPPNDAYYVLLPGGSCGSCVPPDTSFATTAHVLLDFPAACAQQVSVSVVGTTGPPSCRVPDPAAVICPEFQFALVAFVPGAYDFAIPIPAPCPLTGDAFLRVSFVADGAGCATLETRPRLSTTAQCSDCTNYNIYPGGDDDLCALNFPGALVMSVEVASCAVPVLARSWGSVKTIYR